MADTISQRTARQSTKKLGIVVKNKKIEEKGRRALAIPGDVSKESDVIKMIRDTIERGTLRLGSLDVVRIGAHAGFDLRVTPAKPSS